VPALVPALELVLVLALVLALPVVPAAEVGLVPVGWKVMRNGVW
jgi:hypothetical protein